jgi:hypothetical protein
MILQPCAMQPVSLVTSLKDITQIFRFSLHNSSFTGNKYIRVKSNFFVIYRIFKRRMQDVALSGELYQNHQITRSKYVVKLVPHFHHLCQIPFLIFSVQNMPESVKEIST